VAAPPQFTVQSTPAEILNQAGEWLARQLGSEFRWVKSRQTVSRTRGARTEEIRLQSSKWNRAGIGTWATLRVTVRNKDLAPWRRSHPNDTLLAHYPDLLWTNEFINVDKNLYFVELFGHVEDDRGVRQLSLLELVDAARGLVLPVLDHFESPEVVADWLPDNWLVLAAPLVEWAICLGDQSSARRIAERMMRVHPEETTAFERGRASFHAGDRPALGLGEDALGWLSARHELFPADEPLPWTLPAKTEKERVIASGRELLERLRSELRHFQETRPGRLHDEQLAEALDLVDSWLAELTGQLRFSMPTAHQALTYLVREFGISETELGRDLMAFEDAAARLRRSQPAK
jgi:hypothetical protein